MSERKSGISNVRWKKNSVGRGTPPNGLTVRAPSQSAFRSNEVTVCGAVSPDPPRRPVTRGANVPPSFNRAAGRQTQRYLTRFGLRSGPPPFTSCGAAFHRITGRIAVYCDSTSVDIIARTSSRDAMVRHTTRFQEDDP